MPHGDAAENFGQKPHLRGYGGEQEFFPGTVDIEGGDADGNGVDVGVLRDQEANFQARVNGGDTISRVLRLLRA